MIQIKTQELRDAVQAAYEFDKEHGKCTDESTGQFTGNFYHETYEFDDKSKTYYFDSGKLFAYKDVLGVGDGWNWFYVMNEMFQLAHLRRWKDDTIDLRKAFQGLKIEI